MVKDLLIFAGGVLLGSAATYLIVKKKYEKTSQDEIEEIRNIYFEKCRRVDGIRKMEDEKETLKNTVLTSGYTSEEEFEETDDKEEEEDDQEAEWEKERIAPVEHPQDPYTITPHQFAYDNRHYEKLTLLYYPSEEALVSEETQEEEDVNMTIGEESLKKFGEFDEDVAYVRNDRVGIDYEVILMPESEHYYIEEYDN